MARSIVITGASSGIGAALALLFAKEGATLGLMGRDAGRLSDAAARCTALGAATRVGAVDVCDSTAMAAWLEEFDAVHPVDLLIANAGISLGTAPDSLPGKTERERAVFETNVAGVLNAIHPILPRMAARGRGQIAIVSSIAAFVPLADSASYSASKAAVLHYGLALRSRMHRTGVRVNVICPGYVTTPMAARNAGWKPFEMSAERAAERISRGLARDKAVIAFPRALAVMARVGGCLPDAILRYALAPFGPKPIKSE